MTTNTATTTTATPVVGETETFVTEYLGEGNWEVQAENGEWDITADTDDTTRTATAYLVTGPNHHHAETWHNTFDQAVGHIAANGRDRRVKA